MVDNSDKSNASIIDNNSLNNNNKYNGNDSNDMCIYVYMYYVICVYMYIMISAPRPCLLHVGGLRLQAPVLDFHEDIYIYIYTYHMYICL